MTQTSQPNRADRADEPDGRIGPPAYPASQLAETREIATAAGWPAACPDPLCRRGRCAGRLRSVRGGPKTFSTCLAIIARWHEDAAELTLREADAMLGFLQPGAGWTMQPTPPEGETGWPFLDGDGPAEPADLILAMMPLHLGAFPDLVPPGPGG